jgi:DNA helicase-2/ATP-dependent DNA helicase PcrA
MSYDDAYAELNETQRYAVDWQDNAALVLAGPGSGKTKVLTTRIARLLRESPTKNFRILALTFTNKAADEMAERVAILAPGMDARMLIGTFHAFCSQVLRQHGSHIGIQSNFTIYNTDDDRKQILHDATKTTRHATTVRQNDKVLEKIDELMYRFATLESAPAYFRDPEQGKQYAEIYHAYEQELRRLNALDFNSLLVQTYRLITEYPAIAARYQRAYPYWLIDEFQDTNTAQYRLIKALAGTTFKNVVVVADDDQIIYEWNGASYKQLERFRQDFTPELIQLPTNYRCPATIIAAANQLVQYNNTRTPQKALLIAAKTKNEFPEHEHIRVLGFDNEAEEAIGITEMILESGQVMWGHTVVLARTRSLLDTLLPTLKDAGVSAVIAQRRDHFLTPQHRWLQFCLRQVVRPLDKGNFIQFVNAYNKMASLDVSAKQLTTDAEQTGLDYLDTWATAVMEHEECRTIGELVKELRRRPDTHAGFIHHCEQEFRAEAQGDAHGDLADDCKAWQELKVSIAQAVGRDAGLDHFLQQLDLRSKEPTPPDDTVRLMTIHAAKGTEANYVYVMGMAEDHIPSFHSIKKGDDSPQMEEERRGCFVAITRTKEQLTLSAARSYRGWSKQPSRFLTEMGLVIIDPESQ